MDESDIDVDDDANSDADSDLDFPQANDAHLLMPQPSTGPPMPYWRRMLNLPVKERLVIWTAQQLYQRGKAATAPAALRRCATKLQDLRTKLRSAQKAQRRLAETRASGRIKDVVKTVSRHCSAVKRAQAALLQHRQTVIRTVQRDRTCHFYFSTRPLPPPFWWT